MKTAGELFRNWQKNKTAGLPFATELAGTIAGGVAGGVGGMDEERTYLQLLSDVSSGAALGGAGSLGGGSFGIISSPTGKNYGDVGALLGGGAGTYQALRNAWNAKKLRNAERIIEQANLQNNV